MYFLISSSLYPGLKLYGMISKSTMLEFDDCNIETESELGQLDIFDISQQQSMAALLYHLRTVF